MFRILQHLKIKISFKGNKVATSFSWMIFHGFCYLFRNQIYGEDNLNMQYASANPLNFGIGHDDFNIGTLPVAAPEIVYYQGEYYIVALNLGLDGIRMAKLQWKPAD